MDGWGSSPLARGLPGWRMRRLRPFWIIPARAGFTIRSRTGGRTRRDHPRSRGVYGLLSRNDSYRVGSSPLARGLRRLSVEAGSHRGIIPARAGFTIQRSLPLEIIRDHPRSRGVYPHRTTARRRRSGSSPLARGLHNYDLDLAQAITDHPRSRGVYAAPAPAPEWVTGSSPLARGLHLAIGVIPTVGHPTRGRSPSLVT